MFSDMIAVMAICMLTSYKISSQFMNISYQNTPFGGLSLEQLNISPFTVVVVIVSLLISFLIFALIAGISGAGCSSMEDIQPACMAAMLLSMGGYMISCIVSGFQNRAAGGYFFADSVCIVLLCARSVSSW